MKTKEFRAPDGATWTVEVTNPGASNAIVVFHHPSGHTRNDRYAWYLAPAAEARKVTATLDKADVLGRLADRDLQRLFRTSYAISEERAKFRAL